MTIGINQTTSPLKFCFLIEPNSEERFERAVKIAFSYWGGIYCPILPLFKVLPEAFIHEYDIAFDTNTYFRNTINNYDPDIILYDDSLEEGYIKTLIGDRTLLTIESFLSDTISGENNYGVSTPILISHIIETEFKFKRNDELKLLIPNTQNSNLFLKSFLGCFLDSFQQQMTSQLNSFSYFEQPEITFENIATYFPNKNITTLDIITQEIISIPERFWYKGETIYFLNETRLNDLINFWNLRALGWNIIPIPLDQIDNGYFSGFIERFTEYHLKKSNGLTLITFQVSKTTTIEQKNLIDKKFQDIRNKINGDYHFSFQGWFPRFWEERSILEADKALCEKPQINSTYSQIDIKENFVKFKTDDLPFNLKNNYNLISL